MEHGGNEKRRRKRFQKRNGIPVFHKECWLKGIIKLREKLELLKSRWDFCADAGGQRTEKGERPQEGPVGDTCPGNAAFTRLVFGVSSDFRALEAAKTMLNYPVFWQAGDR